MPRKHHFVTVRDPRDSVWQSVVEQVAKSKIKAAAAGPAGSPGLEALGPIGATPQATASRLEDLVDAANAQVFERDEISHGRIPPSSPLADAAAPGLEAIGAVDSAKRCSSLAVRLAKAKVFGTAEQVKALQSAFDFNVCDPFWAQCVNEYVSYFQVHGHNIPYRAGLNNVLPYKIPATASVALFGDWGTGMPESQALLVEIKKFNPDVLMHLGDIYYSGTQDEIKERFLDVCTSVFGAVMPRRFSLSGNHDMYSGGAGYYGLVDQIEQRASYFAIQNDDWLLIGMDTGVHDFNPLQGGATTTFLNQSEADWVNKLVANSKNQKIIFFSHHPLFSAYDAIGGEAVNMVLLSQLHASLPQVTAWFWGHEHRLGVYDSFQGLARGRCLGHAAVPVFDDGAGDAPTFPGVPVHLENGKPLPPGVENGVFKHGYAIMSLNGKSATVSYFRQGETAPIWRESF
jgi:Calcineurin-like phosphoesterase